MKVSPLRSIKSKRLWELAPLMLALYRQKATRSLDDLIVDLDRLIVDFENSGSLA